MSTFPICARMISANPRMMRETSSLFKQADSDPNVRVVIFSARGKCFSAGLDRIHLAQFESHWKWRIKRRQMPILQIRKRTPHERQNVSGNQSNKLNLAQTQLPAAQNRTLLLHLELTLQSNLCSSRGFHWNSHWSFLSLWYSSSNSRRKIKYQRSRYWNCRRCWYTSTISSCCRKRFVDERTSFFRTIFLCSGSFDAWICERCVWDKGESYGESYGDR